MGRLHGYGKEISADGKRYYEGQFKEGVRHGRGKIVLKSNN